MTFKTPLVQYVTYPYYPPALPVRRADDRGGPAYVARATISETHVRGLTLAGTTQTGESVTITITACAPGTVRVQLEDAYSDPGRVRLARDVSDQPLKVRLDGTRLVLDDLSVHVTLDPFRLTFYGPDGDLLLAQDYTDADAVGRLNALPFGFSEIDGQRVAFHDSFEVEPDEHFFGFGEQFTDFDKRGQRVTMWHYDALGAHSERAYKNIPFFVSTRGYGLFVDSVRATRFDMAASSHSVFSMAVPDSALDYYVIAGPEPKTIIARYGQLVGLPILPPKWAFGLWMSSGFKEDNAEAVLSRARDMRAHDIPCDVMHLDCYWQRYGRWSEMLWDEGMFPDPAGMVQQLDAMGFKVCLWMNPYLGTESERFVEAREKGYLLKRQAGEVWVGDLWNGHHPPVGIIDMTNPAAVAWFKDLLRPHLQMGVDAYKTDFGEGIPPDVVAHNGMTGEELHNLYPLLYNDAVAEVTADIADHHSGLVWGRSTFAGGQRHAAQWSGDPNCTYPALASTLRGGLSIGMCGHAFWSHDIGGFNGQPTPDLYIRWAQFGLLSPLARAHGRTTRLPWDYGDEAERIFRDYAHLRYRLMPYIYTYARIAARTSLPMLRPMVLEFPHDPSTFALDLQYMFGENLLVAPIYKRVGRRPVYFPAGQWVDFWTREVIAGPQTRTVQPPLDVLPLYVRANALIPTIETVAHLGEEPFDEVTFEAYVLDSGAFDLEDTDGITHVAVALRGTRAEVEYRSPKHLLAVRLLPLAGQPAIDAVLVNGRSAPWLRQEDGSVHVALTR
ncbi:MAG: alpha-xylosidase [Chloroflexota bacterium]|jgi:alpha-D-xyloside xylohydrolase